MLVEYYQNAKSNESRKKVSRSHLRIVFILWSSIILPTTAASCCQGQVTWLCHGIATSFGRRLLRFSAKEILFPKSQVQPENWRPIGTVFTKRSHTILKFEANLKSKKTTLSHNNVPCCLGKTSPILAFVPHNVSAAQSWRLLPHLLHEPRYGVSAAVAPWTATRVDLSLSLALSVSILHSFLWTSYNHRSIAKGAMMIDRAESYLSIGGYSTWVRIDPLSLCHRLPLISAQRLIQAR
jgi:hypothetical protein